MRIVMQILFKEQAVTYDTMLIILFITMYALHVHSLSNKTDFKTIGENDGIQFPSNSTNMSLYQNISRNIKVENNVSDATEDNTNEETFIWTFLNDEAVNGSDHMRNTFIINNTSDNEFNGLATILNNNSVTNFDHESINAANDNEKVDKTEVENDLVTDPFKPNNMSWNNRNRISHPNKEDTKTKLKIEKKKVVLHHHLQLVPMENKPFDSAVLQKERYLICILVPVGVGMIGAVMIACTVVTLRKAAMRRPIHTPLDDDAEVERSMTSHISGIVTDSTDKVFLLHTDEI